MLEDGGRAVLIDLGFAGAIEAGDAAEPSETVAGTAAYLAPERARGAAGSDARSDVYALGATLFHLVVGKLPFSASDDAEVLAMQIFQSLTSPELKSRGLSPHLHYFVEKMMSKDVADRYQSFAELGSDVRAHLAGRSQLGAKKAAPRTSGQSVRALRKRRKG
jgi:serine/threonine-protein kinase